MAEQKNQDLNQLLKIRRDKLAELQANGKDPFQITSAWKVLHSEPEPVRFLFMQRK